MHRMQLTLLLEHGNLDESSAAPHPGPDYRELSELSAFQTETLFGGWPASLGDMVRFLAQAGLSHNARTWEQTLFFGPRPGTQVLVPQVLVPLPPSPPPSALGYTRRRAWSRLCPPPTLTPPPSHAPPPTSRSWHLSEKHAARTEKL